MTCPSCSAPLKESAHFCTRCGAAALGAPPLSTSGVGQPPAGPSPYDISPFPPPTNTAPPSSGRPTLLAGVALALVLLMAGAGVAGYFAYRHYVAPLDTAAALELLPPGDVVVTVDIGALVNTGVPRLLADSPEGRARYDALLAESKTESGIDPKQLRNVTLSVAIPKSAGEPSFAAIVTGSFDLTTIREALERAREFRTETYDGHTIYIRREHGQTVGLAVINMSTVAVGSPLEALHAVLDARSGKASGGAAGADLREVFAITKADATVRGAIRMPRELGGLTGGGSGQISDVLAARFIFGSLDVSSGVGLEVSARMDSPDRAAAIRDALDAFRTELRGRSNAGGYGAQLDTMLETVVIGVDGQDVRVSLDVPDSTASEVVRQSLR